ncbi:MAG: HEAT repeat domain-containing protein [Planctomycetes bacterium]|nr:HEAT repeat domain-containing protein [Planctomycetota bacterium]
MATGPITLRSAIFALLGAALLGSSPGRAETLPVEYVSPADRAHAATMLGKIKSGDSTSVLVQLSSDSDGAVRWAAVHALASLGDSRARGAPEEIRDDPAQARVPGVEMFDGQFTRYGRGGRLAEPGVCYNVQLTAFLALVGHPREATPEEIRRALDHLRTVDRSVLERFTTRRNVSTYYGSRQGTEDRLVFDATVRALENLTTSTADETTDVIVGFLGSGIEDIVPRAAGLLLNGRSDRVLPHVRSVLEQARLTDLSWTACLRLTLKHDPASARPLAIRLLRTLHARATLRGMPYDDGPLLQQSLRREDVPLLRDLLGKRTDEAERKAIEEVIARVEGRQPPVDILEANEIPSSQIEEALPVLLAELNKEERDWKTFKAEYQLGRLQAKGAIPGLLKHLGMALEGGFALWRNTASSYQGMAGWALVQIGDRGSVDRIREVACSRSHGRQARSAALLAYALLAGERAVPELAEVFLEEDRTFRCFSTWSVGAAPESSPPFARCTSVRESAALALAQVGGNEARAALCQYLYSEEPVTLSIAEAVHRVDPEKLDGWSRARLESNDPLERSCAVGVRFAFFPTTCAGLVQIHLEDAQSPLHGGTLTFLRRYSLADESVSNVLIGLLRRAESGSCNDRLVLIEALGVQGGEKARATLEEFALTGKVAKK